MDCDAFEIDDRPGDSPSSMRMILLASMAVGLGVLRAFYWDDSLSMR